MLDQVPTPVLNLIRSAFPSSLGRVPTLLQALVDSLIIRHTGKTLEEPGFSNEVKAIAIKIKEASELAEGSSNSFPVELPFLDAEGLEKQVCMRLRTASARNLMEARAPFFPVSKSNFGKDVLAWYTSLLSAYSGFNTSDVNDVVAF